MKKCNICGLNFVPRHRSVKFCSDPCRSQQQKLTWKKYKQENLELCRKRTRDNQRILNNKNRFGGLREIALKRDKYTCSSCNKKKSPSQRLVLHHKDHNKKNNTLENFITLCQSCHAHLHYKEDCRTHNKGDFAPISNNLKCYVHHRKKNKQSRCMD